jgi:hypothetical protein
MGTYNKDKTSKMSNQTVSRSDHRILPLYVCTGNLGFGVINPPLRTRARASTELEI